MASSGARQRICREARGIKFQGYKVYEGIVETDRWFGPLFTNLRLTCTHALVEINPEMPLLQFQPIQASIYGDVLNRSR